MYTSAGLGAATAVATTTAITVLPKTGGNVLIDVAVSLAAGLLVWGVEFVRTHNTNK